MAIDSTSLITVDEYLIFSGKHLEIDSMERSQIEQDINWASIEVEEYVGRTLISGSAATEIFSGHGIPHPDMYHHTYITKQSPLMEDPTPKLYTRSSDGTDTIVDQDTWSWRVAEGHIYFNPGYYFVEGQDNYKAVYDYGYANTAAIPSDLKRATATLVTYNRRSAEFMGITQTTQRDTSKSYDFSTIPTNIATVLNRYVR